MTTRNKTLVRFTALVAALFVAGSAYAEDPCGLCDKEIVINSALATCFLDKYQQLAGKTDAAVVVDLSGCEQDRGIVEALPTPNGVELEPDLQFMVTPGQLQCLKTKLDKGDIPLDPSARIELDSCG